MIVSSALPDLTMISVKVFCLGSRSDCASNSAMPSTPFIGVRISWLILARNSDFARSASTARRLRFLQLLLALLLLGDVDGRAKQIERAVGRDHRALARHLVARLPSDAVAVSSISWLSPVAKDGAIAFHEGEAVVPGYLHVGLADRVLVGNARQVASSTC